jgi:hypothetical protein
MAAVELGQCVNEDGPTAIKMNQFGNHGTFLVGVKQGRELQEFRSVDEAPQVAVQDVRHGKYAHPAGRKEGSLSGHPTGQEKEDEK